MNLAEVGARTSWLVTPEGTPEGQLEDAVIMLEERNGNSTPVDDVDLITIDIGGNDFEALLTACVPNPAAPACLVAIQTVWPRSPGTTQSSCPSCELQPAQTPLSR